MIERTVLVAPSAEQQRRNLLLLASVFVIAACGLIYELIAAALSSYLIGNSVTQFSIVIGLFMFAMGCGSFAARWVRRDQLTVFVAAQLAIGAIGGVSALGLFWAFAFLGAYEPFLVASVLAVGAGVGLEIPLLITVLKERRAFDRVVSTVLALDYVGALAASLLFPLLLVPYLGLIRTGFLFGLLNVAVAGLALWRFGSELRFVRLLRFAAAGIAIVLMGGLVSAGGLTRLAEDVLYNDEIILTAETQYQRIVVTRWHDDYRLFLNGALQFSSIDEARYHEPLIHPAMTAMPHARRVLILGGGDGMAAREILKYDDVERIDLVDLDTEVTRLFREHPALYQLNSGALRDERVRVHGIDAAEFLEESGDVWDVIVIDLPDPTSPGLARLYSRSFYRLVARHLAQAGVMVTQATSPFYAPDAFWCIVATLEATTAPHEAEPMRAVPYHVNIPSFGEWGFVLASRRSIDPATLTLRVPTRFLNDAVLPGLFRFPDDMQRRQTDLNQLDRPVLVRYYEQGWRQYNQ